MINGSFIPDVKSEGAYNKGCISSWLIWIISDFIIYPSIMSVLSYYGKGNCNSLWVVGTYAEDLTRCSLILWISLSAWSLLTHPNYLATLTALTLVSPVRMSTSIFPNLRAESRLLAESRISSLIAMDPMKVNESSL